jgi:hypothetical protein
MQKSLDSSIITNNNDLRITLFLCLHETLNFRQGRNPSDSYFGILTTGNCFNRQGRGFGQNANDRPQMEASVRQLVDLIELDLLRQIIVKHGIKHMRVSLLKGAGTMLHVNYLRGVTDMHVMITQQNETNMFTLGESLTHM